MQKKKGISLIVLVITIIVMIILAGTIILTLNNSGIIDKASEAIDTTNESQAYELAQVKWAEAYLSTDKTQRELEKYVLRELANEGITEDEYFIKVTTEGVTLLKSVVATVDGVPIPKGFVASQATGEKTKNGGLVIYEGSAVVTDANVETARRTRNQYVWIPVDTTTFATTFVRGSYDNAFYTSYSNVQGTGSWEVELDTTTNLPLDIQSTMSYMSDTTLEEVQNMYASVKKYGGFYIARYEAGVDDLSYYQGSYLTDKLADKVYSVMGKVPYSTRWGISMLDDSNGAVEASRCFYTESNMSYGVVSTLTYGVQWDAVIKWWIDTSAVSSVTNSASYGNFGQKISSVADELNENSYYRSADSGDDFSKMLPITSTFSATNVLFSTGALKAAEVSNIYDMAGNIGEWTMEGDGKTNRATRGYPYVAGSGGNVTGYSSMNVNHIDYYETGFRPSLYIK